MLPCAEPDDTEIQVAKRPDKVLELRLCSDDAGKINLSVLGKARYSW